MKTLSENKKAYFAYQILEKLEAGMVLIGQEVKSIRMGRINLKGSYIILDQNEEAYLVGSNIPPYQPKNAPDDYNPERARKLLLKKSEIKSLIAKSRQKGLTLVPLRVYTQKGRIKLEFAVAKGKKERDKRESIKKRETEREISKAIKSNNWG